MCIKTSKRLSISGWNVNGIFKNSSGAKTCKLEDEYFNEIMKSDIYFCRKHILVLVIRYHMIIINAT
jgi:hypothetical protein